MKKIGLFLSLITLTFASAAQTNPGLVWARSLGGPLRERSTDVAIDGSGNVYTLGTFEGTADFDPSSAVFELTADEVGGTSDIFISKLDIDGNFVWAKQIGGEGTEFVYAIAVDASGDVFITGEFNADVDFDPGSGTQNIGTDGSSDGFILKLLANGNFSWVKTLVSDGTEYVVSVAFDAANDVYIAGGYSGDINASGDLPDAVPIYGGADVFAGKLSTSGTWIWSRGFGGTSGDFPSSGAVNANQQFYIYGVYNGTIDFNPGSTVSPATSAGDQDLFMVKLDDEGDYLLGNSIGGSGYDTAGNIVLDGDGSMFVIGSFETDADVDPSGTVFTLPSILDSFIAKYSSTGQFTWALNLDLKNKGGANAIAVDADLNIFVTGTFSETIDIDPGPGVFNISSTYSDDINAMVIKFDASHNFLWGQSFGGYSQDQGYAIKTDADGSIYVIGNFKDDASFATDACTNGNLTAASADEEDVFIIKLQASVVSGACFGVTLQPVAPIGEVCVGSAFDLYTHGAGTTNIKYQWQKFDGFVWNDLTDQEPDDDGGDGYSGSQSEHIQIILGDGGIAQFRCKITGDFVTPTFTDEVSVNGLIAGPLAHVVANSGCGPGQYLVSATGGANGDYHWFENGVPIDGSVNSFYTTSFVNAPTKIQVSIDSGCAGQTAEVLVNTENCAPDPGLVWAKKAATGSLMKISQMAVDASQNVYSSGYFYETMDFDPGPGVHDIAAENGSAYFIQKLDQNGDFVWAYSLGSLFMASLELDGLGNIYVGGYFRGEVDFDPGAGTELITATNTDPIGGDMFITKLNTDGEFQWVSWSGSAGGSAHLADIACDATGNVHVTGTFTGTVDFDPSTSTSANLSASGQDIFILKLTGTGTLQWVKKIGSSNNAEGGRAIDVDDLGNVYTTGFFGATADFNPGAGVFNLTTAGSIDVFVSKLDALGTFVWAEKFGGTLPDMPNVLKLDATRNVHVGGYYQGTADFDPTTDTFNLVASGSGESAFVMKLDEGGNLFWAKDTGGRETADLALDATGHVYTTGYFDQAEDFNPGAGTYIIRPTVSKEVFVSQLDASGNFGWAYSINSSGLTYLESEGAAIATDISGNIYASGIFDYTGDFDPGFCTFPLENEGNSVSFIQKIRNGIFALCFNILPADASMCAGIIQTLTAEATGTTNITYQWQLFNPLTGLYEDVVDGGGYSGATTSQLTIDTSGDFGAGTYQCHVTGDNAPDKDSPSAVVTVSPKPSAPGVTGATACSPGQQTLTATGSTDGNYVWYDEDSNVIAGEVNGTYVTPFITATTFYYVSIKVAGCEGDATEVDAVINITVTAPGTTGNSSCSAPASLLLSATGGTNGQYRWYASPTDPTPLAGEVNNTYTTPSISTTTSYYVSINDGSCESPRTQVDAVISPTPDPGVTPGSRCDPGVVTLTATGSVDGNYLWYSVATGGTPIAGEVNGTYNTPSLSTTTTFYASISIGTCESGRVPVDAIILSTSGPSVTGASSCGPAAVTLTAAGAAAGQYRWYTASTGGTAIAGEQNDTYVTPSVSTTTSYFVSIDNGSCESGRSEVIANINTPPAAPTTTGNTTCGSGTLLLTAAGATNGQYRWYTQASGGVAISGEVNSTYTTPSISATTDYYVSINNGTCESTRAVVTATITTCTTNQPPVISAASTNAVVQGNASINLIPLLSDPDNNLDLSSLTIIVQPKSGAVATIDNGVLKVNYTGVAFIGTDELTIEVCDMSGSCVQRVITIEVAGGVVVYNAVSPNGDGKNDVFYLDAIDFQESTKTNHVKIFNRWGSLVFDIENYDNKDRVFTGKSNGGEELPSGTYYYKVEFAVGAPQTGYLTLKK